MSPDTIRQNLSNSLKASGTPQFEFALDASVSPATLNHFLHGKHKPHYKTLSKIENAMMQKGWLGRVGDSINEYPEPKFQTFKWVTKPVTSVKSDLISFIANSDLTKDQKILFLDYLL